MEQDAAGMGVPVSPSGQGSGEQPDTSEQPLPAQAASMGTSDKSQGAPGFTSALHATAAAPTAGGHALQDAGNAMPLQQAGSGAEQHALRSAVATQAAGTPTGLPEDVTDANAARIGRAMQSAVQHQGGNLTVRLNPPELGFVRIEMNIRDGVVRAQFNAEQPAAREMLSQQLGQLRQALEKHGLSVERLEVQPTVQNASAGQAGSHTGNSAGGDGRSAGEFFTRQQSQQQSRDQAGHRGPDPSTDTFESLVNALG